MKSSSIVIALQVFAVTLLFLGSALTETALAQGKAVATAVDTSGPVQLIETSANTMVAELEARRAEFRKDPAKLSALV